MRVERLHSSAGRFAAIQSRTSARKARSAGSSSTNSVVLSQEPVAATSSPQNRQPIAEHDVVSADHAALECGALALGPNFRADGLAGKNGFGEPRLETGKALRPIVRD